jgi:hypothetical protein
MNGTGKTGEEEGQHNVMEIADYTGKPFPCPVCNRTLQLKNSRKLKPYCMCLDCGIQIFFRGQEGIRRLRRMIHSEEAVVAEFNGPAPAISLFNRLQGLKRQRQRLEDQQGLVFRDADRDRVIESLDAEIEHVREELEKEMKADTEKQK